MAAPPQTMASAPGSGGPSVVGSLIGVTMPLFHGDAFLGEVEVFQTKGPDQEGQGGRLPFPGNEIRVSHFSPPGSARCPPLAVLRSVAPLAVRCKLQGKLTSATQPHPGLHELYLTCASDYKTAVVTVGDEELHLVAMPSWVVNVPCFWCCSVRSGVYAPSLRMLKLGCLALVLDLDDTLVVANTMDTFDSQILGLSRRLDVEEDPVRIAPMSAAIKRYIEDRELLKKFRDTDTVTDNGRIVGTQQEVVVPALSLGHEHVIRPVIRLPERNAILTRINPKIRDTSVFVKIRPAWEEMKKYLTGEGRAKKSLQNVFLNGGCHPKMAMVIDDRPQVWDDVDQPRIHVIPPYTPYYAPQAEMESTVLVFCAALNVACSVHGSFFRDFHDKVEEKMYKVFYENEFLDLPYAPDVSDYLVRQSYVRDQRDGGRCVPPASTHASDDGGAAIQATGRVERSRSVCPNVLQEIAQQLGCVVQFRSTASNSQSTQFLVEVLFNNKMVGVGVGRTKVAAQTQAAEKALQLLQSVYLHYLQSGA